MDDLTVASKAIGIDIGAYSVKVVSLHHRLGSVSLEKAAEAPIERNEEGATTPEAVVEALRKAMSGIRVRKDVVVVGVSTQAAAVRSLSIPFSDVGKARAVIKFQAEPHLPFTIEEVVVDFFDAGTGTEERMDVLLTAIRKPFLQDQVDRVREVGIDPEVLEVDFMAVYNTINKCCATADGGSILMDIGGSKTIIAFIRDGIPLAVRSFPVGGDTITGAISREMKIPYAEAEELKIAKASAPGGPQGPENDDLDRAVKSVFNRFSGEVGRTLRFIGAQLGDIDYSRVALTGGGAGLSGMAEYVGELLGHEVTVLDEVGNIKDNTKSDLHVARFATAIGLGLRGLGETPLLQNFRKEEVAYSQAYKRMRTSIYTAVALLVAIYAVYVAGIVTELNALKHREKRLFSDIKREAVAALGKLSNAGDPLKELESHERKKLDELRVHKGARLFSVLDVLKELSEIIPEKAEVELTLFRIPQKSSRRGDGAGKDSRSWLTIKGSAKSNADVLYIKDTLGNSKIFERVRSDPITMRSNRSIFTFRLQFAKDYK